MEFKMVEEIDKKPETAESWIDYFLNQENNTPIDMPNGDLLQWTNWWNRSKAGNITRPPHTTMSAITESPIHIEPIKPVIPESRVPMEKSKKKYVMPSELYENKNEKKKREPSVGRFDF